MIAQHVTEAQNLKTRANSGEKSAASVTAIRDGLLRVAALVPATSAAARANEYAAWANRVLSTGCPDADVTSFLSAVVQFADWVISGEADNEICPVCRETMVEPQQCGQCKGFVCWSCMDGLYKSAKGAEPPCPLCRNSPFYDTPPPPSTTTTTPVSNNNNAGDGGDSGTDDDMDDNSAMEEDDDSVGGHDSEGEQPGYVFCPECNHPNEWADEEITCDNCNHTFDPDWADDTVRRGADDY